VKLSQFAVFSALIRSASPSASRMMMGRTVQSFNHRTRAEFAGALSNDTLNYWHGGNG
jgi:hypothetical protein